MRIDVLNARGEFIHAGLVPRGRAVMVDDHGQLSIGSTHMKAPASARVVYPDLDLPALDGVGRVRLSDHRGKAVVINVWASWCAPCRLEMPALDALAAQIDTTMVAILGFNDDENPMAARRFVNSLGGVRYPLAAGRGTLADRLRYPGLPYTVVLDREHRVVDEIRGYGGNIDPIRRALDTALGPGSEK